jgi:hypothetical protein
VNRLITTHIVPGDAAAPLVLSIDSPDPNAGNAFHNYLIVHGRSRVLVPFQRGPIKEHGQNGVTEAALLAVLIDRLEAFNASWPGEDNAATLHHLRQALHHTTARTRARMAAGIEGTNARDGAA